jgi:hypothetical protein
MADPYAQDDIVVKELHIPKGKRFILNEISRCFALGLHAIF